ncbi:MAG: hypothetical protein IJ920_05045 [Paludibacteraceae bacterium]|nr:hypothetical protein [Paludibacteraceae bacterium]
MNRLRAILCIGLTLCAVLCRAERTVVTHTFNTMKQPAELQLLSSNKVGKTPLLTYTCYNSAAFGIVGGQIYLNLTDYGDSIITTRVEELEEIQIHHGLNGYVSTTMDVYISKDSARWEKLTGDSIRYISGNTTCSFPKGSYFIKWRSKKSSAVNIQTITYYQNECNCFVYEK